MIRSPCGGEGFKDIVKRGNRANLPWHGDGISPPYLDMWDSDGSPLDEECQGDAHAPQQTEIEQGHAFQNRSFPFGLEMETLRQDRGKHHAKHDGVAVQAFDLADAAVRSRPPRDEVPNDGGEVANSHVVGPLAERGTEAGMDLGGRRAANT